MPVVITTLQWDPQLWLSLKITDMNHLKIRPFAKLGFVFLGDCYKNCRNRNYSQFKQSWDNLFYLPVVISTTKSHHRFHMGIRWHIQETEQFVKVLVKLNKWICVTYWMDRTSSAPNILSTVGLRIRFIDFDPEYGIPSLVFYYSNWKFETRVKYVMTCTNFVIK